MNVDGPRVSIGGKGLARIHPCALAAALCLGGLGGLVALCLGGLGGLGGLVPKCVGHSASYRKTPQDLWGRGEGGEGRIEATQG